MSQDRHHFRMGYQFCAEPGNDHQGQIEYPSAFVLGQIDGDSVVHSLNHAPSSGTVHRELMQTGIQELQLDSPGDFAHGNPQSEADSEPLVFGTYQQERTLRRKPKWEDLRAKAAFQATLKEPAHTAIPLFDSLEFPAVIISLPQQRYDSLTYIVPDSARQERDPKDGRRSQRGHRASERPLVPSPSLSTLINSQVEIEPCNKLNDDPRFAGHTSQQSHSRPDAQNASEHRAQGAGFLTSQEWQQRPTTYGPGSPYEIARTRRRTAQPQKLGGQTEEETTSNASTLVAETPFDPIAGLEGFEGIPTIRGEGYHYPQILHPSPTLPLEQDLLGILAAKDVTYEDDPAKETHLQNVPAHVLCAGNIARVRRGYPASDPSSSAGSSEDVARQEFIRARVPSFTLIPAFEEYSIPPFSWQRRSSKMTAKTSTGMRQLALSLSLRECLYEIDW